MKLKVVNTTKEFSVQVTDDSGKPLVEDNGDPVRLCVYESINSFTKDEKLYAVLGPYWSLSDFFEVYELVKVPVQVDEVT